LTQKHVIQSKFPKLSKDNAAFFNGNYKLGSVIKD